MTGTILCRWLCMVPVIGGMCDVARWLFLSHEHIDGCSVEVPVLAYLVLKVAPVWLFDPLWKVAEEDECGYRCLLEHGDVFDFYEFALVGWGWICSDGFLHHGVELRGGHGAFAVGADLKGCLEHFVDALLGEG